MTGVAAQADSSQSRLLLRLHRHIDALEARLRAQDAPPPSRDDLRRLRQVFRARMDEMVTAISADFGRPSRPDTLVHDPQTVHRITHADAAH